MISLEKLFKSGVHFGHQKRRWCPKMAPYIWGSKNNVHLIDIAKTAVQLEKAAKFLQELVGNGKTILWVGTKKPAQKTILEVAEKLDMPYVSHRWIGGTLSNFAQVKKSVTKYLHYKDVLAKADKYPHYTKKELNVISKAADRLEQNIGGILNLKWPVGALVIVDVIKESSALKEAASMGIPVVGLVDTNSDPSLVDIVVPTNDDSPRAIRLIVEYLSDAVEHGKQEFEKKKEQEKEAKKLEKAAKKEEEAKKASESKEKAPKKAVEEKAKTESSKKDAEKTKAIKTTKTEKPVKDASEKKDTVSPAAPEAEKKEEGPTKEAPAS